MKHRNDGFLKLSTARFVNATSIHPEISLAIVYSSFGTELDLFVASFVLASPIRNVIEGRFVVSPGMRE
jgi:hypothetical protein